MSAHDITITIPYVVWMTFAMALVKFGLDFLVGCAKERRKKARLGSRTDAG